MAGVRHERPLALERRLDAVEHRVERRAQPPDLVVGGRHGQPRSRLGRLDLRRAGAHALDRPERRGGGAVARERGEQQRDRPADQQQRAEAGNRLVAVVERLAHDHHAPARLGAEQPVAVVVELAVDGHLVVERLADLFGAEQRRPPRLFGRLHDAARRVEDLRDGVVVAIVERARARLQVALDARVELMAQPQVEEQARAEQHDRHHGGEHERDPQARRHDPTLARRVRAR